MVRLPNFVAALFVIALGCSEADPVATEMPEPEAGSTVEVAENEPATQAPVADESPMETAEVSPATPTEPSSPAEEPVIEPTAFTTPNPTPAPARASTVASNPPSPAAAPDFDVDTPPDLPTVGPEDAVRLSYDHLDLLQLMNLDPVPADVGGKLPQWMVDLDGQRVRLRGFMFPPFVATGLRGFVLARDNEICCFGRDPKIYDIIPVEMRSGVTTDYIEGRPFDVVGTFNVEPEADGEELFQLFYITDAIVIQ